MKNSCQMLMGWSEISITPDKRVGLMGQFIERISDSIETPVTATALAISVNGEDVILCSCDLVTVTQELITATRKIITAKGGPDADKIIWNATHTHTSLQYRGGLNTLSFSSGILERYFPYELKEDPVSSPDIMGEDEAFDYLAERLAEVVLRAWEGRVPSSVQMAFGRVAIGMCRRATYRDGSALMWGDTSRDDFLALESGNDSGMELMYIHNEEGKLTGVVANLSCPAQVLEHRTFLSSDYWGKVKRRLREHFGDDLYVLALCGPAGDLCPRDLIRWVDPETPIADPNVCRSKTVQRRADPSMFDLSGAETIGRRIASEIIGVYEDGGAEDVPQCLYHTIKNIRLPVRRVTEAERDEADRRIREAVSEAGKNAFDYRDNAMLYVYAGTIDRYESQDIMPDFEVELHILRIGDVALATAPFELFHEYGNRIRGRSLAAQTFLVQLAAGSLGYLPTATAEAGGHYSAYVSSGITGHEGGDQMVEAILDEINQLFVK